MDIYELIKHRQSDRKYDTERPVPPEAVERILEAARLAPSATNSQPWHFIVVDQPELRDLVAEALTSPLTGKMNHFARQAPLFIVVVEESGNISSRLGNVIKRRHFPHIDLGIAAEHIALAATHEGLGSCIIGWVNEPKVRRVLGIPKSRRVPLVISLGYSLEEEKSKRRKPREEVISYNQYQAK
ncbi:MAG: nitroreductase family protein [Porphyromonas sp.]|nr:nitroreductase family protein [Porphyromonas sp.]